MTKVAKIQTLYDAKTADEFIEILKNNELLIFEDVQGSEIFVNWNGVAFTIKPKSINNKPLTYVDLVSQKYYYKVIKYFDNLPEYVQELLNPNYWYVFEYFPDEQPANIQYNRVPKNNLIFKCIVKKNKFYYNVDEILEFSKLFDVEPLPIIFKGKLNSKQLEVIQLYLNLKQDDVHLFFEDTNFAYFFYKILNPNIENSFLMNENNFNENLEKIIIKIDNNPNYSFELLNPFYKRIEQFNNSNYSNTYSMILIKFLEFLQTVDLNKIKLKSLFKDELYVELMCNLFNMFIENNEKYINEWNISIPQFFKEDKFKVNLNFIINKKTKNYIKYDHKNEYIFKCILNSFNEKKKKIFGLFTELTLETFNNYVEKIDTVINNALNINKETEMKKNDLKDFSTHFNLKFETDLKGNVYLNIIKQEEKEKIKNKKLAAKGGDKFSKLNNKKK